MWQEILQYPCILIYLLNFNAKFFLTSINRIKEAIINRKLVIFAGAGISFDAGAPLWGSLIEELKNEIDVPTGETDYLKIAQMYYNERKQKEFLEKVRLVLKHKQLRYNEIHESILKLEPDVILTTNFDDLLDQVIKAKAYPYSIVKKDSDFPYVLNSKLLVKVHGDLDNSDIVLTEDDFLNFTFNRPLTEAFIKSIFATKVVLFVGYSMSDYNLKLILQQVSNILGKDFQSTYLLNVDNQVHSSQRDYLKNKGVNVINFHDADEKEGSYIDDFFKETTFNNDLSEKGLKLLKLLRYIRQYDPFKSKIKDLHFIKQLSSSLNRFEELKTLPGKFITSLYPLKSSQVSNITYREEGYINSKNEDFTNLFFENLKLEKVLERQEKIVLPEFNEEAKQKLRNSFNENQINQLEKELKNIFGKFLNGGIQWIQLDYRYLFLKIDDNSSCDCLVCLYYNLKFDQLLIKIDQKNITETSSIEDDLKLAYVNYKVGKFYRSFELFEEIANKAWQIGKYISYFIAKKNIKLLKTLIQWEKNNTESKDVAMGKIVDIDLDKLIYQIPNLSDDEYRILKIIRDDQVLEDCRYNIDINKNEVLRDYHLIEDGGTIKHLNDNKNQLLTNGIIQLFSFYRFNNIVYDEYSDFKDIIQNGLEALIIKSLCNDLEERAYTKKFSKIFGQCFIIYGKYKELENILPDKIEFYQEDKEEILILINNFFNSNHNNSIFQNEYLKKQLNNSNFFSEKNQKLFDNICLLLSRMEINLQEFEIIFSNLIAFLNVENFLSWRNIDVLLLFIRPHIEHFSKGNFEELLNVSLKSPDQYYKSNFLIFIDSAFEIKNYVIDDVTLVNNIFTEIKNRSKKGNLIYLWRMSNESNKDKIKEYFIETLNGNFDLKLYELACHKKLLYPLDFFATYFDKIISEFEKLSKDYKIQNGKPINYNSLYLEFVIFVHRQNIELSYDQETILNQVLPDYAKFYLKPHEFDLQSFNLEWLFFYESPFLIEKLKGNVDLKIFIENELKENYSEDLSRLYFENFN